uniref:C-type lectin domain-containing protein n=1 Tax=Panagrolaimus sp. ES5 TaxID=591445 RepID=A0AC34GJL0_9BILA
MLIFQVLTLFLSISLSFGRTDFSIKCAQPNHASFSGDKCWMLVSIPMNFIEAAQFCRSFDGNLTSIHSAFDNIYLADMAQQNFALDFFYIGGTNLEDRKTWAWMDGSAMDFADWGN